MRILIAEDDAVNRTVLHRTVMRDGQHQCLVAVDGEEAWDLYQRTDVDVVISDWMMPGIDGIELCRRIRQHPKEGYAYFIFLSSLEDREHILEGMRAGADDYLTKPLNIDELRVRLMVAARVTSLHHQIIEQRNQLERLNRQLVELARTDPLTALGNRLRLREQLEELQCEAGRTSLPIGVALIDIDLFKGYNDRYGHLAGDSVLQMVAEAIAGMCTDRHTAFRYGGEEFLLLFPGLSLQAAAELAEGVRQAVLRLAIPYIRDERAEVVTISGGVAMFLPGRDTTIESALAAADAALYQAKGAGRNRVMLSTGLTFAEVGGPGRNR